VARFLAPTLFPFALVGGLGYGGVHLPRHPFDWSGGLWWALVWALVGVPSAAAYGFLQGLIGIRSPMPKCMGVVPIVGLVAVVSMGVVTGIGPVATTVCTVLACLLLVRAFGMHLPSKRRS
jgi:hypothetical protein